MGEVTLTSIHKDMMLSEKKAASITTQLRSPHWLQLRESDHELPSGAHDGSYSTATWPWRWNVFPPEADDYGLTLECGDVFTIKPRLGRCKLGVRVYLDIEGPPIQSWNLVRILKLVQLRRILEKRLTHLKIRLETGLV